MSTYKDKIALRWTGLKGQNIVISLVDITIISFVPLLLLLLNNSWIYAKYGNVDEWMYVGYGYNYMDPSYYTTNYKISRLPWVLTEALVRGSFSPLVSSWILGFGVLALGNITLYLALKIPFGRLPALVAAIFIAGLTLMHANGGADYHNTLAGAFNCLAMLFCARCARQEINPRDVVFFGASLALSIHTNPVFINLAPILAAQYLLSYRLNHTAFPPLFSISLLVAIGVLGATILLGLINYSFGRQFLFFMPQFKLVGSYIADSSLQKPWWEPWSSRWFLVVPYMGLFFAGTLVSVTTILMSAPLRSVSPRHAYAIIYSGAYLCAVLIWVFWQTIGQTAFQPGYFAFPLGFPLAGAVAAAVAAVVVREVRPVPFTIFALCLAAATTVGLHEVKLVNNLLGGSSWPLAARASMAFGSAFGMLILVRWSLWLAPFAGAALCATHATAMFGREADYTRNDCAITQNAYELTLDVGKALRDTHISVTSIFVFADDGEKVKPAAECVGAQFPLNWLQTAVGATGFAEVAASWDYRTLDTVDPERWRAIVTTKGLVAFLTYDPARIPILREKVKAAGGRPGDVRFLNFREGHMELPLYILPLE